MKLLKLKKRTLDVIELCLLTGLLVFPFLSFLRKEYVWVGIDILVLALGWYLLLPKNIVFQELLKKWRGKGVQN